MNIFGKLRVFFSRTSCRIYNLFFPTALILCYHRVADVKEDPYLLAVSPANFYNQLEFLNKNYNIISLKQLVEDLQQKKLKKNSLVITFDDGYADNLTNALPILEKFQVPATVFVTVDKIDDQKPFSWDEQINQADQGRPMTLAELKKINTFPLIEIGSHTLTHPHLPKLALGQQKAEIEQSQKRLEEIINQKISGLCYPFGEFDQNSLILVEKAGYQYACQVALTRVTNSSNRYALPRFIVRNCSLAEFKKQLKNFL